MQLILSPSEAAPQTVNFAAPHPATQTLMTAFYTALNQGMGKAEAL